MTDEETPEPEPETDASDQQHGESERTVVEGDQIVVNEGDSGDETDKKD